MFAGIEDNFHDGLSRDKEFPDRFLVLFPNFGGDGLGDFLAIFEVEFDEEGHDDTAFVFESGDGEVFLGLQELPFTRLEFADHFFEVIALFVGDFGILFLVVEILELLVLVDVFGDVFVALGDDVFIGGFFLLIFGFLGLFVGITKVEFVADERGDGEVDVVGGVEPRVPEPVKIDPGGIFHGAEEVGGFGAFEHPAGAEFFEGVVEDFATQNGFAKDGEPRGGLAVGVGAELENGFGIGHDGALVFADHV